MYINKETDNVQSQHLCFKVKQILMQKLTINYVTKYTFHTMIILTKCFSLSKNYRNRKILQVIEHAY